MAERFTPSGSSERPTEHRDEEDSPETLGALAALERLEAGLNSSTTREALTAAADTLRSALGDGTPDERIEPPIVAPETRPSRVRTSPDWTEPARTSAPTRRGKLVISPSLLGEPASRHDSAKGAREREERAVPTVAERLGGTTVEAARLEGREAQLAQWRSLEPGRTRVQQTETGFAATRMPDPRERGRVFSPVDVTALLTSGGSILRKRPGEDPEKWEIREITEPRKEGLPPRVQLTRGDGGRYSIGVDELMRPDEVGRIWVFDIPRE